MPIAAVPNYLDQQALSGASPGMRFGMYLPIWTERADQEREVRAAARRGSREGRELAALLRTQGMDAAIAYMRGRRNFPDLWEKNNFAAQQAWKQVATLSPDDVNRMRALADRQAQAASLLEASGQLLVLDAESVAPFTTGLGNEHPLENGFSFLWPYGLPYLPGSGVKGVLRQAARELAGIPPKTVWNIESEWTAKAIDALFGHEDAKDAQRGALSFWDVIPQIKGNSLLIEVMTPHQTHYYQGKEAPHDSGQPNPISFLTIPPGSEFTFRIACNLAFLRRVAPDLAADDRWKALLRQALEHAFAWLGFGAKTAVGYGAMQLGQSELARRRREQKQAQQLIEQRQRDEEQRRAEEEERRRREAFEAMSPAEKALHRFDAALAELALPESGPLDQNRFSQLKGLVNELAKVAPQASETERERLAEKAGQVFATWGWAPSGLKKDKRKKQESKNRGLVEAIREGRSE